MKQVTDAVAAAFVERVKAACSSRRGAADRLAAAAGLSRSAVRNVAAGFARPGYAMIERVSAVLDDPSFELGTQTRARSHPRTRVGTLEEFATEKTIENDPECARLRVLLAVEETRVRKAVAELLGCAK